ncbi:MAG TPA: lysophospholipid acyltransferase family protein [Acetobacteraceae bacterium]|nr:lysophospholipid acyltransferase family protein [Acetobacteraceae bacterium]
MKGWLKSPRVQAALAGAMGRYLRFVVRTIRWQVEDHGAIAALAREEPGIFAFWHETLPSMPVLLMKARQAGCAHAGYILVSRHRDGQFVGHAMGRFGLLPIAGSTSRGGAAGLRAMIRALRSGASIALTPDGPRGPRRVVAAAGVGQLAALSGAPLFACAAFTRPAIRLPSWDRMRIPLPFTHGALVCRPAISVPRGAGEAMMPAIGSALQEAIAAAEARCR